MVESASNRNEHQESSWGGKGRPARRALNFTDICEPIVLKLWELGPLTKLPASTACYKEALPYLTVLNMTFIHFFRLTIEEPRPYSVDDLIIN
jgi:hypothetical protein